MRPGLFLCSASLIGVRQLGGDEADAVEIGQMDRNRSAASTRSSPKHASFPPLYIFPLRPLPRLFDSSSFFVFRVAIPPSSLLSPFDFRSFFLAVLLSSRSSGGIKTLHLLNRRRRRREGSLRVHHELRRASAQAVPQERKAVECARDLSAREALHSRRRSSSFGATGAARCSVGKADGTRRPT